MGGGPDPMSPPMDPHLVRPLCQNLGSRVHFLVKSFLNDFQLAKYMQVKGKDVYNFCLQN